MLDKKDLKAIRGLMEEVSEEKLKNAFSEFYDSIFLPYAERNEKDHAEMKEQLSEISEYVDDHDKRLVHLESFTGVKSH